MYIFKHNYVKLINKYDIYLKFKKKNDYLFIN